MVSVTACRLVGTARTPEREVLQKKHGTDPGTPPHRVLRAVPVVSAQSKARTVLPTAGATLCPWEQRHLVFSQINKIYCIAAVNQPYHTGSVVCHYLALLFNGKFPLWIGRHFWITVKSHH